MNPREVSPPAFGRIHPGDVPRLHAEARARIAALRREAIERFWQRLGDAVRALSGRKGPGTGRPDARPGGRQPDARIMMPCAARKG